MSRWWGEPDPVTAIEDDLLGDGSSVLLVVELGGEVAGGIQYHEEDDPMYRHAGIDIYLGTRYQGRGRRNPPPTSPAPSIAGFGTGSWICLRVALPGYHSVQLPGADRQTEVSGGPAKTGPRWSKPTPRS